jgi:hypothetical protein
MAKKIITFEVDQSKLFDMVQSMKGDCGPLGERLFGAMVTGKTGMATDLGLGVYGIVFQGGDEIKESSGCVYADLDIPEPAHGEVRRNGGNAYVWDDKLKTWVQTKYAEDETR